MCYYKLGPEKKNKGIQVRQSGLRIASAKRGGFPFLRGGAEKVAVHMHCLHNNRLAHLNILQDLFEFGSSGELENI